MTSIKVTTPQVIVPAVIDLPTYQYGQSQQELDADIALRNLPTSSSNVKIGYTTISGAGDTVITGVGFTPSMIKLDCSVNSNANASWGVADGTNNYCTAQGTAGGITTYNTSCINIQDGGLPSTFIGTVSALGTDGFTINIGTFAGAQTLRVIRVAFG